MSAKGRRGGVFIEYDRSSRTKLFALNLLCGRRPPFKRD
jgi:hypothetical protein